MNGAKNHSRKNGISPENPPVNQQPLQQPSPVENLANLRRFFEGKGTTNCLVESRKTALANWWIF
jgi:hypothetical protein